MESKISEANTHVIIFGWSRHVGMGISLNRVFTKSAFQHLALNRIMILSQPNII